MLAQDMITIPGGHVTLSDRRTQRSWSVEVPGFALSAYQVTRELYDGAPGDRLPAVEVTWWEAVRYCNRLSLVEGLTPVYQLSEADEQVSWDHTANGYRLPTEAEWEYACRAGTAGPRYGELDEIAWYVDNSDGRPHAVGLKAPNPWGLYDMLGNAFEWCWDLYDPQVYGSYRVLRGGGWCDEHWSCRASVRRRSHPTYRVDDVGFRVARDD